MADDDHPSNPGTQAFVPDFSDDEDAEDTGTQSWVPDFSDDEDSKDSGAPKSAQPAAETPEPTPPGTPERDAGPGAAPVHPVTVPGRYVFLRWWKLVLVLLGVWIVAAPVGLALFYWWYHSTDKTLAVFAVLVYVVACAVGGVMLAMAEGRPLISALSLAVMSAPFAALAAAAPLYGYYYCARTGHCVIGVIPY
ncbi:hypothetical protein [Mycobacterium sp. 852002-51057_SCH5723018]|uniref:hypothetical protein n=1 Tax=Mycobacterium sp. 852002-51057_SCH5723018 TaxID=1834094 RepID=UPI0007FF4133|nr:hypothetical protein [Mycobacterium sp. 852002-51057_SCH5723018]OBG28859.1 hypothetical protein A5764_23805 [Mycobacterium sp. 852002-51057_SCH5723018]